MTKEQIKLEIGNLTNKKNTLSSKTIAGLTNDEITFLLSSNKQLDKLTSQLSSFEKSENEAKIKLAVESLLKDLTGNFRIVATKSNGNVNVNFSEVKPKIENIVLTMKNDDVKEFSNFASVGTFLNWHEIDSNFLDVTNNNARYISPFKNSSSQKIIEGYSSKDVKSLKVVYSNKETEVMTF